MERAIKRWIICFNGYTQGDRWRTGVGKIHRRILTTCSGPDTYAKLCSWRDNVSDLADRICEWGGSAPEVKVFGYSYGGYTSVLLCRELEKRGIEVENLVLIDAVWRWHDWLASFQSLFSNHEIRIPVNVKEVLAYRQQRNKPSGHDVVVDDSMTQIEEIFLNVTHAFMDDQDVVLEKAMQLACPKGI